MKKLFLPLALLSLTVCVAEVMNAPQPELTPEQLEMQRAYLQNAGALVFDKLLQNEAIKNWFATASDEDKMAFANLCIKNATLNIIVVEQNKGFYDQLFTDFTELTVLDGWYAQLQFMSKELAASYQAQQYAQQGSEEFNDESDDLE